MPRSRNPETQANIVKAIGAFWAKKGYPPSFRDVAAESGVALGTVYDACQLMRTEGRIDFMDGVARTLTVV